MKKIIIIIAITAGLILAVYACIPLFFKKSLLEKTQNTISKKVNAEVKFDDLRLSVFRSFPGITLSITNLMVTDKGKNQPDTILQVPYLRTRASLGQLLNRKSTTIESIFLDKPQFKLVRGSVEENEISIIRSSQEENLKNDSEYKGLTINISEVEIKDGQFFYDDPEQNMLIDINDINLNISGNLYGTRAEVEVDGISENFTLDYGGIKYITNTSIEVNTLLDIDYSKIKIDILKNNVLINRLPLEFKGSAGMPGDTVFIDMELGGKKSGFENLIALIPSKYKKYTEDFQSNGNAMLTGNIKGYYYGKDYPAFDVHLDVKNGNLQHKDLPGGIKNITTEIIIAKPQGISDFTSINIDNIHAGMENGYIDMTLVMKKLFTDPEFSGRLKGRVNLDDLKDALPLDSISIAGIINADLSATGNYSSLTNEEYNKIQSDGALVLSNIEYKTPSLAKDIIIPEGELSLTPGSLNLNKLSIKIGESDFIISGKVNNYIDYLINKGILNGNLQMNSAYVNLDELLRLKIIRESGSEGTTKPVNEVGDKDEVLVFNVPGNIDFSLNSFIKEVLLDQLMIQDVRGLIVAKNGALFLDGLNMKICEGNLQLTGSYRNTPSNKPLFDFGFDLDRLDIYQAYKNLPVMRKMMPVAGHSQGKISSRININGILNHNFKIIPSTVDGGGSLRSEDLIIVESPIFSQLKGLLNPDKLNNVKIDNFSASLEIEKGSVELNPFTTRISDQETTISGNINAENILDMRLDFNVEREAFGPDIQNILSYLPGQQRIRFLPATVVLKGPVKNPDIKINLEEARKMVAEEVKKSTKEDFQRSLNKLGEGLRKFLK